MPLLTQVLKPAELNAVVMTELFLASWEVSSPTNGLRQVILSGMQAVLDGLKERGVLN